MGLSYRYFAAINQRLTIIGELKIILLIYCVHDDDIVIDWCHLVWGGLSSSRVFFPMHLRTVNSFLGMARWFVALGECFELSLECENAYFGDRRGVISMSGKLRAAVRHPRLFAHKGFAGQHESHCLRRSALSRHNIDTSPRNTQLCETNAPKTISHEENLCNCSIIPIGSQL